MVSRIESGGAGYVRNRTDLSREKVGDGDVHLRQLLSLPSQKGQQPHVLMLDHRRAGNPLCKHSPSAVHRGRMLS